MKLRAILFDLYGTLIDIETDEERPQVWDTLARFLGYQGLFVSSGTLKTAFFARQQASLASSLKEYPELDVPDMLRALLAELGHGGDGQLALQVTRLYRMLSIVRFGLFPDTLPGLRALNAAFALGLVSDAQRAYLDPEIDMCGLRSLFDVIVVSSDCGYRKPDPRLFAIALRRLGTPASQAIYVGDNVERDVCGAHNAGLRAVLLREMGEGQAEDLRCQPDVRLATLDDLCRRVVVGKDETINDDLFVAGTL
jgi:putative hydrolase of the HAD superfamily